GAVGGRGQKGRAGGGGGPPRPLLPGRPPRAGAAEAFPGGLAEGRGAGVAPYTPCAPARLQRKPVIISSKISSAPFARHSACTSCRNPSRGSTAVAGSRITHAIRPGWRSNNARTLETSL